MRKVARPKSWSIWTIPRASAAGGRRSRERAETITYSWPLTSTARPSAPVVTVSPASSVAPRAAWTVRPPCWSCTFPATSVTRHSGTAAKAAWLQKSSITKRARRYMNVTFHSSR